jgi:uncharacterized protein (TIGR00251 family)
VPNAANNAVVGRVGNAWKLRVHAPPEDGKANKALVAFLATTLNLPQNAITLTAGTASREKRFRITGITDIEADARLQTHQTS